MDKNKFFGSPFLVAAARRLNNSVARKLPESEMRLARAAIAALRQQMNVLEAKDNASRRLGHMSSCVCVQVSKTEVRCAVY